MSVSARPKHLRPPSHLSRCPFEPVQRYQGSRVRATLVSRWSCGPTTIRRYTPHAWRNRFHGPRPRLCEAQRGRAAVPDAPAVLFSRCTRASGGARPQSDREAGPCGLARSGDEPEQRSGAKPVIQGVCEASLSTAQSSAEPPAVLTPLLSPCTAPRPRSHPRHFRRVRHVRHRGHRHAEVQARAQGHPRPPLARPGPARRPRVAVPPPALAPRRRGV